MAQTIEEVLNYQGMNEKEIQAAMDDAVKIVKENLKKFTYSFKSSGCTNGFYEEIENVEWTSGFWTGSIWLAYEYTQEKCYREAALIQVNSFLKRIEEKRSVNHHDMGFLYSLSCVSAYKLTGNENAKKAALLAADQLMGRFCEKGNFFQAWGDVGDPNEYRLIIDCLLNLPLLYWASDVTGNREYAEKAEKHIDTVMKCIVRADNSTYHTFYFDKETGNPKYGVTHQGNRNDSAWARGQAWGIYGIALSYRYLKKAEYIELFYRVTDYFIKHLPDDLVPYWDFDFDTGSTQPRDSSSAAIAICGILEMCPYMTPEKRHLYSEVADRMLKAITDHCLNDNINNSDGILLHGTYGKKGEANTCKDINVDECNVWGDYFYMEALTRRMKEWNPYW